MAHAEHADQELRELVGGGLVRRAVLARPDRAGLVQTPPEPLDEEPPGVVLVPPAAALGLGPARIQIILDMRGQRRGSACLSPPALAERVRGDVHVRPGQRALDGLKRQLLTLVDLLVILV